ncbi:hypothetical protein BpHYR1_026085 [Brachionus plicatilis]|uniref:Uncharacterized protein n=1 Tax=Brachionus plicatilis TaxID=10195 RepID=A0A3M7S5P6_BRAPC|nr:hypothetical protein BpHYR1_026085 [Brachionus plicatilis]
MLKIKSIVVLQTVSLLNKSAVSESFYNKNCGIISMKIYLFWFCEVQYKRTEKSFKINQINNQFKSYWYNKKSARKETFYFALLQVTIYGKRKLPLNNKF